MSWSDDFYSSMSVDELREKAREALREAEGKGRHLSPVIVPGRTICRTWWGKAWCRNMEQYLDYENRLPRGRSYVKNGAVIDLVIGEGKVSALVQGSRSRPYEVEIRVSPLGKDKMKKVSALCSRELDSLEELVKGKFPKSLETLLTEEGALFPTMKEIKFDCSCPDWARMCKHVAAVMYGIGVRLDENPFYFFILRGMDPEALLRHTVEDHVEKLLAHRDVKNDRIIADAEMEKLFHLEE